MREFAGPGLFPNGRRRLVAAAAIGFGIFSAGLSMRPEQSWVAFLVSSFFFLTVALGAVVFLSMMSVANARWHLAFKRVPESMAAYLPVGALSIVALLGGMPWLYHWALPGAALHDPSLEARASYLNTNFFAARMFGILLIWVTFGLLMRRFSNRKKNPSIPAGARQNVALSALFLLVFPFSISLACIDWIMSLDPHWSSSIFGLYNIAGLLSAAVAAVSVLVIALRRRGGLPNVGKDQLHDLGKLLFGFSTVWAYLWFSQYLLVWYTNLPEENTHYVSRMSGGISILFFLNFLLSWVLPFVLLLSRDAKRSEKTLMAAAILVLTGRWLDIHLLVAPAVYAAYPAITVLDVALFVAFGAAFLFTIDRALAKAHAIHKDALDEQPQVSPFPIAVNSFEIEGDVMNYEKIKRPMLALLLAALLFDTQYLQAQTQTKPVTIGTVAVTTDFRTRVESWDWFNGQSKDDAYTYSGSLLRLGFSQKLKSADWQLEFAAPVLLNLPENAVGAGAQGQFGLGATYYVANDRKRNSGMVFVKQGFIRFKPNDSHSLRLGRFEYVDGTETTPADETLAALKRDHIIHRLVGSFGWTHVGRSLDGAQYVYSKPATNVSVVAARPTRGVFQLDGWGELNVGLVSVTLTRKVAMKNSVGELRAFGIQYHDWRRGVLKTDNRPAAARSGDSGNVRITSAGGNYIHAFTVPAGKLDVLFWGVLQTGTWGVLDHRAGSGVVEIGYQPNVKSLKPWFRVGSSYGSGDKDPNDGRHNTFFQLLPTPRVYARLPFYNMMNNQDSYAELTLRPHQKVSIRTGAHSLRLAERNDLWYQGGGAYQPWTFGFVGRPSNGNRSLSTVFDVGAEIQVNSRFSFGTYFADAEARAVTTSIYPDSQQARFGYVELRYRR